jgi:hypothetical protein
VTTDELARRIGGDAEMVAYVLADELGKGRVRLTADGRWSIVAAAFPPGTLDALRELSL